MQTIDPSRDDHEKQLALRARLILEVRNFFFSRGFLEVETPALVPSPGLGIYLDAFETNGSASMRYLATSPEYQMKRLLSERPYLPPRVMQICKAFRRGEVGEHHNPEFTMLEWYRAHAGIQEMMRDTEQLVAKLTGGMLKLPGSTQDSKDSAHLSRPCVRTISCLPPFKTLTVCEAFWQFSKIPREKCLWLAEHDEETYFLTMANVIEPQLSKWNQAVFLTDFPASQAALAQKKESDPMLSERFELYIAGIEICNGFGELTDSVEQKERFKRDEKLRSKMKVPVYPIDEKFLSALENLPPTGGNALGLDRLIALCSGTTNIGPVLSFTESEL